MACRAGLHNNIYVCGRGSSQLTVAPVFQTRQFGTFPSRNFGTFTSRQVGTLYYL